jgi:hypothetical protein
LSRTLLSIKFLLAFVRTRTFIPFGIQRIAVALPLYFLGGIHSREWGSADIQRRFPELTLKLYASVVEMPTLRQRFEAEALKGPSRLLLGEDWVFDPPRYPALAAFTIVYQEASLRETPLAILRNIHLAQVIDPAATVQVDVALCLNDARDAIDLLFQFADSFERLIPVDRAQNTAQTMRAGDFGVAWSWSGEGPLEVVAFVRHNVVVMLQRHHGEDLLPAAAREIDAALSSLRTVPRYADAADGFFSEVKQKVGPVPRVAAGASLPLGRRLDENESYFFLVDGGSVNRDRERTDTFYFRAGMNKGRREITLFRLGAGILPVRERLAVDVT